MIIAAVGGPHDVDIRRIVCLRVHNRDRAALRFGYLGISQRNLQRLPLINAAFVEIANGIEVEGRETY